MESLETDAFDYQKHWLSLVFQGRANAPVFVKDEKEVIEYIQQHEGAIGLLHAELAESDLRLKIREHPNSLLARIWGPFLLMAVGLISWRACMSRSCRTGHSRLPAGGDAVIAETVSQAVDIAFDKNDFESATRAFLLAPGSREHRIWSVPL